MTNASDPNPKERKGVDPGGPHLDQDAVTERSPKAPANPNPNPMKPEPATPDANPIDPRVGTP